MTCIIVIFSLAIISGCTHAPIVGVNEHVSQAPANITAPVETQTATPPSSSADTQTVAPQPSTPPTTNSAITPATSATISEAAAREIALGHAGLSEAEVAFIKSKLDYDDGRTIYDVEFYVGNIEYDYEIDAYTGDIRSYDYDIEFTAHHEPYHGSQ